MSGCRHFDGIIDSRWFLIGWNLIVEQNDPRVGVAEQFPFLPNVGPHFLRFFFCHFCHGSSPMDILNRRHTFVPLFTSFIRLPLPSHFVPMASPWVITQCSILLSCRDSPISVVGCVLFVKEGCISLDYTNAGGITLKTGYLQSITIWSYL